MRTTRKLVYAAAMTATAVAAIAVSRFFPLLTVTPLMLCSLCFYVSLECGWRYGLLTICASLILGFFVASLSGTFLWCALIFAPYSILAKVLKKFDYKAAITALIRIGSVTVMFNALFAVIVFALGGFVDELIFSYTLDGLLSSFNNLGYIILAILGTLLMIGFDFMFAGISKIIINKYLKIGGADDQRIP